MFHENAIEAELREWMDAFEADKNSAMAMLLNLFLAASGAAESLTNETAIDSDAIDKVLTGILKNFDPDVQNGYPLLPKAKGRIHQKFKKNIIGFLEKIMMKSRILEEKAWMWQIMYQWLGAMSSSRFKPFRHSATFIANTIQCSLCDFLKETINDLNIAELQLGSCKGKEQRKLLEKKVYDLNEGKEELESWTDNFFEGIFIHRCRDSDSTIRAECGIQICSWMSRLKEKYMDPQYLRYVGWMLADKAATVRLEYMKGLSGLLAEANVSNLRLFLDRFKNRILEIASKDEDLSTRLVGLEALSKMSQLDLLEDEDSKVIVSILFESEPKVRSLAAKMIPKIISEKQDSIDETNYPSEAHWELHCLCKVFVECSESAVRNPPSDKFEYESDDQDLSISQEELMKAQERDQKQMLEWLSIDWVPGDLPFGIYGVKEALQSLWANFPIVKDWRSMGEYLVSLFDDSDPALLSPQEDLCLLYLFSSSISLTLNDLKKSRALEEERLTISRALIKILPLLLNKYKSTFTGNYKNLMETLLLIEHMDIQVYMDLRMHKAFEDLLSEIRFVCTRHINPDVLLCCVKVLPKISSKDSEELPSDRESEVTVYNQQIQEAVKGTIKDILVDIIFDQLIPQFSILAGDNDTAAIIESSVALRGILTRFDILRCEFGITDYGSFIGDSSFTRKSLLDIVYGIVDKCLSVISISPSLEDTSVETLSQLIDYSIKVSMKDLFFYFKSQVYDTEIEDQSLSKEISQSAERLIAICEAIITSDESDGMRLPLGLKFSCVFNLMTLIIFYNSNISQKIGSYRNLSEMVQGQIGQIIEKSLISFAILPLKSSSYFNELTVKGIDQAEMKLEIQQEIFKSLAYYMQLLNHSLISPKYGSLFLKYFGLSDVENYNELNDSGVIISSKSITGNIFGKTWNSISELVIKSVLGQQFKDLIISRNIDHTSEEKINSVCRFLFKGVDAALELYLSGVIQSLDPVRNLAKVIVSHLKHWEKHMEASKNENLISLQSSIFNFFSKSCNNLIMHINSFQKMGAGSNRRRSLVSDMSINHDADDKGTLIQCHRNSLEEINAVWQILGGIGGAIRHVFDAIGVGFSQFDDLESQLLKFMNNYQIRPNESSKPWETFWQFLKSVGKGDARIRKQKRGIKAKTKKDVLKDASSNAPARRSNRARTVKVMRDDSSSEEDADSFLEDGEDHVFVKASTPKKNLVMKEDDDDSDISIQNHDLLSQVSDDPFNELSSIIKRKPPSEFETDDFASSPPALSKKVRY